MNLRAKEIRLRYFFRRTHRLSNYQLRSSSKGKQHPQENENKTLQRNHWTKLYLFCTFWLVFLQTVQRQDVILVSLLAQCQLFRQFLDLSLQLLKSSFLRQNLKQNVVMLSFQMLTEHIALFLPFLLICSSQKRRGMSTQTPGVTSSFLMRPNNRKCRAWIRLSNFSLKLQIDTRWRINLSCLFSGVSHGFLSLSHFSLQSRDLQVFVRPCQGPFLALFKESGLNKGVDQCRGRAASCDHHTSLHEYHLIDSRPCPCTATTMTTTTTATARLGNWKLWVDGTATLTKIQFDRLTGARFFYLPIFFAKKESK